MNIPIPKVMIVDDEDGVRRTLTLFLEDHGFEILAASNAEEALTIARGQTINVVITDIRLPDMDGEVLIQELYKIQPSIKFLIHTGSPDYFPPQALEDLGISSKNIFVKPTEDMKSFVKAVANLVNN